MSVDPDEGDSGVFFISPHSSAQAYHQKRVKENETEEKKELVGTERKEATLMQAF